MLELSTIKKHEIIIDKLAHLFTTGVIPIHAVLRKPVKVESLTNRADPNSMLAGLIRTECLDVDNTHPSPIGRIQLEQPDLDTLISHHIRSKTRY